MDKPDSQAEDRLWVGCRLNRIPKHVRGGINQTVAMLSMVMQIPLPSIWMAAWFAAINLPLCMLNSRRLDRSYHLRRKEDKLAFD